MKARQFWCSTYPSLRDYNIIDTWQSFISWYLKFTNIPFHLDPITMERDDTPPDFVAFRESFINILCHQDYEDHTRKPEIRHFPDRTIFWNPGDAFTATDLLEPGPKEVRNPNIVLAFRRIGLSENAGSGLRDVCNNWQQLGHVLPIIDNGKAGKTFQLTLLNDTQQVTEQVTEQVRRLLTVLHGETAATMEIMTWLELRHRPTFLYSYLNPAIENGLIEMTIPDKPRSSNQKYRLTPKGRKLIRELSDAGSD